MKNFGTKLKVFGKAILQKLAVKGIASLIVLLFLAIIGYFKRSAVKYYAIEIWAWLNTDHTLIGSGKKLVGLFSLPFFIPLLLVIILWLCLRSSDKPYRKESTVIKLLAQWVIDNQDNLARGRVVRFRDLDTENELKRGRAKKYLKRILDNHETLCLDKEDKYCALIKTRP